ncbi:MAG: threonine-phosphate decarboxylase CobD [Gammaproteobacteria bacterium]|nr:threonine-phosphate decarboxylase CobD [Gammaproteobacteria bacterium]
MAELHHGGRLREAALRYGIALDAWLDLSTGINPIGWPVPTLPASCWQRLPEQGDGLEQVAAAYYGSANLLPLAGSQAAIQLLPKLRAPGRVGLLQPSYVEHAAAWRRAGHEVVALSAHTIDAQLATLDALLLVNPNNPTGEQFATAQLLAWHARLRERGGWLVVDEAFMDATAGQGLVSECGGEGLIVLRSLGKFFGLAGIRVGFLFAWPLLLKQMARELGPWHVSGPAREVARRALQDRAWQRATRLRLQRDSERLATLLRDAGLTPAAGTALFHYLPHHEAPRLHQALARQGVFTRLFSSPPALRLGLPGAESEWQQLQQALASLQQHSRKAP